MAELSQFRGAFVALVTPFSNREVDEEAFVRLINDVIAGGVHGIVPCGTTGESPTLSHDEHRRVSELAVQTANGRVPVIAGAGSNSTREAVSLAKHAKDAGADAILVAAPYYNKPSQEGLYQHYTMIADAADIPNIIYNIPGRSVVDISDETMVRLAAHQNIVGVKDATGDVARVSSLRALLGEGFVYLSGEDLTAVAYNAQGGDGCISVTANIAPQLCAQLQEACMKGDYAQALICHEQLVPLHQAMFCETNPVPVKYAAHLLEYGADQLRLPLCGPSDENRQHVKQALSSLRLL